MSIMYLKQKKKSPKDGSVKFYPVVKTIRQVGEREVAKLLADETTLNPKEAELALAQLEKVMTRLLLAGYSVKMGDWASFSCAVTAKGADTADECKAQNIERVRCHCRFGKSFRDALQGADFRLVQSLESKEKADAGE